MERLSTDCQNLREARTNCPYEGSNWQIRILTTRYPQYDMYEDDILSFNRRFPARKDTGAAAVEPQKDPQRYQGIKPTPV